jgi:hypothetical protein
MVGGYATVAVKLSKYTSELSRLYTHSPIQISHIGGREFTYGGSKILYFVFETFPLTSLVRWIL